MQLYDILQENDVNNISKTWRYLICRRECVTTLRRSELMFRGWSGCWTGRVNSKNLL